MEKLKVFGEKVLTKARNARFAVGAVTTAAALPVITVISSAEEPAAGTSTGLSAYTDQITSQFTQTASDIAPIIIGILGAGLGIFAIFMGIKLGKKMFNTVAK